MAILFGVVGLLVFNPLLLFIAFFVYLGAASEAQAVQVKLITEGVPVRDAMMTRFRTLSPNDSLGTAADELLSGAQQDFPIVDGPVFRGMLRRETLVQGLREGARSTRRSSHVAGSRYGRRPRDARPSPGEDARARLQLAARAA